MKPNLSETQKKVFEYLKETLPNGVPPSVREIGNAVGLKSTSSVQSTLDALTAAGYIERDPLLKRSIRIPGVSCNITPVPVLGTVTAGVPILAIEQIDYYIPFDSSVANGKELFALRIRGDSMINCGIFDKDIVVCEKTPVAEIGEIVIALIGDEATCKRFYRENGAFRLQPENDDYAPIIVDELEILGKVVASIRYY